jgi:surface polysaccharide O-acyltransferase-like enzyme
MRQVRIDVMRVFATFGVVVVHTRPFEHYGNPDQNYLFLVTNQSARFAVPYFFVMAGYLWMEKLKQGNALDAYSRRYIIRIVRIFVFWSCVYGVVGSVSPGTILNEGVAGVVKSVEAFGLLLWRDPATFLFQGSRGHLWFLSALLCTVMIAVTFFYMRWQRWLLPAAGALYALSLMGGAYATTPVGLVFPFQSYLGPFVGMLFFVIGVMMSRSEWHVSMRVAVLIFLSGVVVQILEALWLWRAFHVAPVTQEQLVSTVPLGIGAAAIALAMPTEGRDAMIARWGPYMLGVYVLHPLVMDALRAIHIHGVVWDIALPVLVFGVTLCLVMLGTRIPSMKPMLQ